MISIFTELTIVLVIALAISFVMRLLKQPLIIGYIITGIIISVFNIVQSNDAISVFSQIGIALLLFMVGLNLNPRLIKGLGLVSIITGVGQVVFTSLIGFFILRLMNFSIVSSLYVSLALAFSSTIIITKLLSDKGTIDSLYGKISIGFLIVQDLIAIFLLMMIPSFSSVNNIVNMLFNSLFKGLFLIIMLILFSIYLMPRLMKSIAKSQEFLFLFSIGWALVVSTIFYYARFSIEIGALLAGISLSISSYRYEISSRMKPLRDFFIIIFFIFLGSQMVFTDIIIYIIPIIVLSFFVLLGNPLIVMILMGILGYTKRTSFLAGLTVAQISEFSFILILLGINLGHLSNDILSFVTMIGLITIAGSTYFVYYGEKIYSYLSRYLNIFEKKGRKIDERRYQKHKSYDIILFGYNRIGYDLLESFKKLRKKFLIVDYNPEVIKNLIKKRISCIYGDASDSELLNQLNIADAKMFVSTIPDMETNMLLINIIRKLNKNAIIIVVSHDIDDAMSLYKEGATYVIMPHFLGGHHTSMMIEDYGLNIKKFQKEKLLHIKHLKNRKNIGHEHPSRH